MEGKASCHLRRRRTELAWDFAVHFDLKDRTFREGALIQGASFFVPSVMSSNHYTRRIKK
jgi:hypothetical protein